MQDPDMQIPAHQRLKDILANTNIDAPVEGEPKHIFDTAFLAPYTKAAVEPVTERHYRENQNREVGDPVDYISEARRHVRKFIENHNTSGHDLPKFGLYVPLFAYVLGGWKATVSTDTDDVLPEAYFEVTHRPNGETYVVQYNKFASVTYFD